MKVLVTVGFMDRSGEGQLVEVDLGAGSARKVLVETPPANRHVERKGFTGATWAGEGADRRLYVCSYNAIHRIDPETWSIVGTLTQPDFNDLHGITHARGRLLVANTGGDAVEVFTVGGDFRGRYAFEPAWMAAARIDGKTPSRDAWLEGRVPGWSAGVGSKFEPERVDGYYTPAAAVLPYHRRVVRDFVHPNHVAIVADRPVAMMFHQNAVVDLASWELVVPKTPGHPHDGTTHDGLVWLTTVNGLVLGYDPNRRPWREVVRLDVFEKSGRTGWLRGLLVTPERLVVGLTEIREMPRDRWCDRPFRGTRTSVELLDRQTGAHLGGVDLTDEARHSKVFAIVEAA